MSLEDPKENLVAAVVAAGSAVRGGMLLLILLVEKAQIKMMQIASSAH